jgi:hypothetical protein
MLGVSNAAHAIYFPFTTTTNNLVRNGMISGWSSAAGVYHVGRNAVVDQLCVAGNGVGIQVGDGSQVRRCTVTANDQSGIEVIGAGCSVVDNYCAGNDLANSSLYADIHIFGPRNRVDGNQVFGSSTAGYGILCAYTNNVVVRNFVSGLGANSYSSPANQIVGPIISTQGTVTNVNPWANYSY